MIGSEVVVNRNMMLDGWVNERTLVICPKRSCPVDDQIEIEIEIDREIERQ